MDVYEFVNMLTEITNAVYHDEAHCECGEYIRWSETGRNILWAEVAAEKALRVAVDIFSKIEFSELPSKLEMLCDDCGLAYDGPQIVYNQETGYKHYAYTVEVI